MNYVHSLEEGVNSLYSGVKRSFNILLNNKIIGTVSQFGFTDPGVENFVKFERDPNMFQYVN